MTLQIYIDWAMRPLLIEQHDFYVAQTRTKVFAQFQDVTGDATTFAAAEYDRLGRQPFDPGCDDPAALGELAQDRALTFYNLLADLRRQVILGALSGVFHQWQKALSEFIEKELRTGGIPEAEAQRCAWPTNFGKIYDLLADFGWNVRNEPFFPCLDACRLIVNTHKHGKGASLNELMSKYPAYLRDPLNLLFPDLVAKSLDHTYLTIDDQQFIEIADSIRAFWVAFPERLYYTKVDGLELPCD